MTRRALPTAALGALVMVAVGSTFLPWVGIGQSRRSSYQLLSDLDTLGVLHGRVAFTARLIWVCQPALASLALLLAVLGCRKLSRAATGAVFVIAGIGTVVVLRAPVQALLGVWLALPTAVLGLVGSATTVIGPLVRRVRTPAEGAARR